METDIYKALTIINSILIALLPLAFFRRQKLAEIKYKELMELNTKTHDITKRADKSLKNRQLMNKNDYERLDYLVSRYKKHSIKLSNEIENYRKKWERIIDDKATKNDIDKVINILLKRSEIIRDLADKLLR